MQTDVSTPTPLSTDTGSKPLISLTDNAVAKVKVFKEKMPDAKEKSFRVFVEGGGCSGFQYGFTFDEFRAGDEKVACGDIDVLVDTQSRVYLMGSVVDFVEDFKGSGFTVRNPNSKGSCGCGTSFTV
ncbi:MAG: iron-sulfur cluster assembly accessory protein [Deltaproteobacteria bacterium]|nr:iron-sulfur cluster assembly accessory protein [Deltaproteobacteria bacterium]